MTTHTEDATYLHRIADALDLHDFDTQTRQALFQALTTGFGPAVVMAWNVAKYSRTRVGRSLKVAAMALNDGLMFSQTPTPAQILHTLEEEGR